MKVGDVVYVCGGRTLMIPHFVISIFGDTIELAPTRHGAGSYMIHKDYIGK